MGPFLSAALSSTPSSALLFSPPPPPPASDDDDDDDKTIWLNRTISSTSLLANCSSSWSSKESFTLSAVFLNSSADITHPLLLLLLLLPLLLSTSSLTDHLFSPGPSFPKLSCKDDDFGGKTSSPLARLLLPLLLLKRRSILTLPCIRAERSAPPTENNDETRADDAKPLVVPPSKTVKVVVLFRICVPEKRECVFWRKNSKNGDRIRAHIDAVFHTAFAFPFFPRTR